MQTFFLILIVFAIAIAGIGIRLVLVKDGEVRGGCAGKNPMLQEEGVTCSFCGAATGEVCREDEVRKEQKTVNV
ncbi:MAG: membrane or secreted protein [Flavobacteriales bacterium]|nr:membrane or secreted protein [Flavobacteriales bacterium]